jgi:tagaturonate reductase
LAVLAGFVTVKQAMDDPDFSSFVADLMLKEIAPAIPYELPLQEAQDFGLKVLDRFRNPQIQHQWMSITLQYSSKMKMRDIPVLLEHYKRHNEPPQHFALGFAAYLLFMRGAKKGNDDKAEYFLELWREHEPVEVVNMALKDKSLWGVDLTRLNGFEAAVGEQLGVLMGHGATTALAKQKKSFYE